MSARAILGNIKKYGILETWRMHRRRDAERRLVVRREKDFIESEKDELDPEDPDYREFMKRLADPKDFKRYLRELHDRVVKEELPAIYEEYSRQPVEDKIIVMERGNSPSPSSAHLAEVLESQGKYRIVYMSLGIREVSMLKYYENVRGFIREMATARAVLISTANDFLSFIDVRPETKIIQLWHGVGMFKKVGYSTLSSKGFGLNKEYRDVFDQYKNYTYVTIASEEQAWMFEDAMHISRDSGVLAPVGISRTDLFFDEAYKAEARKQMEELCPAVKGRKIILYAPTFRGTVNAPTAPDKLDIDAFGEAFSDEYVLFIKHHSVCENVRKEIPEKWRDTFCFDMNSRIELSIEKLLLLADVCITDYSSIAFEYSILERPMLFFAYDLDDYLDERGMYLDYDDVTPGPVCRTNRELISYIKSLPEGFDREEVSAFRQKYAGMCDGHATERTIELIEN